MRKISFALVILVILFITGCSSNKETNGETVNEKETETITYESENGPVEVPANPERVVVVSTYAGNVLALDVPLIGVDSWAKQNPHYDLEGVEEISEENLEKIMELNPDLIIGASTTKNIDKLKEIAPTVTFTYNKVDYLTQHLEIGKLLNKEEEAANWIKDFKARSKQTGEEIKAKIGENATVTVIENFDKELYVFGDNWGRGTEILYQEMGLKMPDKVKENALEAGYYTLSPEVLSDYVGDYLIISKTEETESSFMETKTFKNIPAVQKDHVFVADAKGFYFNDPITLEYQLEFFKEHFLDE